MAQASITIADDPDSGQVIVSADFGEAVDHDSQAHGMIYQLLQSVLATARNYSRITDTAGDFNGQSAEPSPIIVPKD
jgi:hypothetical protein